MIQPDALGEELARQAIERTKKLNDTTIDIAIRLKEAREFMAWSANHMRGAWLDWVAESNKANSELNTFRMAFDRETKFVVATGKDLRDFFNSDDYKHAHAKLADLMFLLEKFTKLKQDGTLDAFADFILKVSCK